MRHVSPQAEPFSPDWLPTNDLLCCETGNYFFAKVAVLARIGSTVKIPRVIPCEVDDRIYIKFRVKTRCYFCMADVTGADDTTLSLDLPATARALNRTVFLRHELSARTHLENQVGQLQDISVAGAQIRVPNPSEFIVGHLYSLCIDQFDCQARILGIEGNRVRVLFPIREAFRRELHTLLDAARYRSRDRQFAH